MKSDDLELIKNLLDDYADMVFNDVHDYDRQTPIDLVKALKIVKREIEKATVMMTTTPTPKNPLNEYENGWRFIVWVGGNDDYYKNFSRAQMDYYNWVAKGHDDVVLTEIQKDGSEKILLNREKVLLEQILLNRKK